MKITPIQSNTNTIDNPNTESVNITKTETAIFTGFAEEGDTVVISQEARDLATKQPPNEKVINKNNSEDRYQKDENNPQPTKNLLIMANRYLDYYLNKNKDLAIKVMDKETKKVIKEIPMKERQKLRAAMEKLIEEMTVNKEQIV